MGRIYYPDMQEYRWYVRYDNVLADNILFTSLSASQLNLLILVFWHLKNKSNERIFLNFSKLRKESSYSSTSNVKLANDLNAFKNMDYEMRFYHPKSYVPQKRHPVFSYFKADASSGVLACEVSEEYKDCFSSSARKEYIGFYYDDLLQMKSKYTKRLFLFLQRFKKEDATRIKPAEFKQVLGIPSSWGYKKILQRILEPADYEFNNNSRHMNLEVLIQVHTTTTKRVDYYSFAFVLPEGEVLDHAYPYSNDEISEIVMNELKEGRRATGKTLLIPDNFNEEM